MSYYRFEPYISVAKRRERAEKKIEKMRKKNPNLDPIIIEGSVIASSWWGKSWNKNLERYADYKNRIGRGRSYVRHRAILDLKINAGKIDAIIYGSASNPYKVHITVKKIKAANWSTLIEKCQSEISSLSELLTGQFPKKLSEIFFLENTGLFPSPDEISFHCDCPDSAYMCKHVACTLYGVGARLDRSPDLFFTLRQVEMDTLIGKAIDTAGKKMLKNAQQTSKRIMDADNLGDVFGIELDSFDSETANPQIAVSAQTKRRETKKNHDNQITTLPEGHRKNIVDDKLSAAPSFASKASKPRSTKIINRKILIEQNRIAKLGLTLKQTRNQLRLLSEQLSKLKRKQSKLKSK